MPIPVPERKQRVSLGSLAGVPVWVWVAGGAVVLGLAYHFYKSKQTASSSSTENAATTASTANAVTNGVTNSGQTLNTWPYDQLTSPYNSLNTPGMSGAALPAAYAQDTFAANTSGVPTSA
jgi:hypothetical protein